MRQKLFTTLFFTLFALGSWANGTGGLTTTTGDGSSVLLDDVPELTEADNNLWTDGTLLYEMTNADKGEVAVAEVMDENALTEVEIPYKVNIDGNILCVTSIGKGAFANCSNLASVTIPNSVTSIEERAFRDCFSLTNIDIPNSVKSIGNNAFGYCTSLTSLTIPNSVTTIGAYAFNGCRGLTSVTIPNSVTSIERGVFMGCTELASVTIPNSVTSIGNEAFERCTGLTSITIPNSVTSIGDEAFKDCAGLTSITIPSSVTSIGEEAFKRCTDLTSITVDAGNAAFDSRDNCNAIIETVTNTLIVGCQNTIIPNSVTTIGEEALSNCSGLTSITIPNSVTTIGDLAFCGCTSLKSITIPNSVTHIGERAFSDCTVLASVTAMRTDPTEYNCAKDAFDSYLVTSATLYVPTGCVDAYKACAPWSNFGTIADDVETDDAKVLTDAGNGKWTDGALLYQVTDAEKGEAGVVGVVDKETLTEADIPAKVKIDGATYDVRSIGQGAFAGCSSLPSVTIPASVTSIGAYVFENCSGLTDITIPASVAEMSWGIFDYCTSLASIKVDANNKTYDSRDGCNAIIETASNMLIEGCKNTVIPASVTSIGFNAFHGCSGLTGIDIPTSVTSIGTQAFWNCSGLTSIDIPNSVTTIGEAAFRECTALASVSIPNSLISIGSGAFSYCSGLTSVNIPDGVKRIGSGAFQNCTNLTSINIPDGVTGIEGYTFNGCLKLNEITIPNSVINIGENAFSGCRGLKTVTMGNNVINIGNNAFYQCLNLNEITIPNTVMSIGERAFYNCPRISNITVLRKTPSVYHCDNQAFYGSIYSNATLHVPAGCMDAYKACEPWSNFETITDDASTEGLSPEYDDVAVMVGICPDANHPHTIDMGEAGKWACCNVGAQSPTEAGGYYAWGETEEKEIYSIETYLYYIDEQGWIDLGNDISGNKQYDVATAKWGDDWKMPTLDRFKSLLNHCSYASLALNGVNGKMFTASNGHRIFLPNAGIRQYDQILNSPTMPGRYWSATPCDGSIHSACYLLVYPSNREKCEIIQEESLLYNRHYGQSVRPVLADDAPELTEAGEGKWTDGTLLFQVTDADNGEIAVVGVVDKETLTTADIPAKVKIDGTTYDVRSIGQSAFAECTGLKSVTIPNSVTTIGDFAFYNCSGLTSINIPNSVTSIGYGAFYGCTGLTSIDIPNSVTTIGDYAFALCSGLTGELVIPNSVTTIGDFAFYNCSGLTSINIPNSVTSIGKAVFYGCSGLTSINIPNSVTTIGDYAFARCSGLTGELEIPNSVTTIGNYAFARCSGLTGELVIPNSVTSIGEVAFGWCEGLTGDLILPESLTYIGMGAFFCCNGITSIFIPASLTTIESDGQTFAMCYLSSIKVDAENKVYDSREDCNAIIETASNTLIRGCNNTFIPNSVTGIGDFAFVNSVELTEIKIPNSVTIIRQNAFSYTGLTSVTIGNGVTSIEINAFENCSDLTSVTALRTDPTEYNCSEGAFTNCPTAEATLYVPIGCADAYRACEPWSGFGNIVELEDIQPLEEDEVVSFGEEEGLYEDTDLDGNVIGNVFYNINSENGGYADGCIVVTKPTSDEDMEALEGQDIFGEDFKNAFTGIVFKVPAGSGTVKVTAETEGNITLKVKIGDNAPIEMELTGKLKASFPYSVNTDTYVYIYAGQTAASTRLLSADVKQNSLKIYSVEWKGQQTSIGNVQTTDDAGIIGYYNSQGQRIVKPQSGVNIIRYNDGTSRKVLVK